MGNKSAQNARACHYKVRELRPQEFVMSTKTSWPAMLPQHRSTVEREALDS